MREYFLLSGAWASTWEGKRELLYGARRDLSSRRLGATRDEICSNNGDQNPETYTPEMVLLARTEHCKYRL